MKNMSTWLLAIFMVMFAILRVIITITNQQGDPFLGIAIESIGLEIALIFLTLLCIVLVVKRKMLGAIIYVISHAWYYGLEVLNTIYSVLIEGEKLAISNTTELLISAIGLILPIMVLLDTLADKSRKLHPVDKKTDWFYKNEQFDRKYDERADRNEYKF